jgi:uncharacterized small protein (DUF1192 family)
MATTDAMLDALARIEERFVERVDESRREIRLDLDVGELKKNLAFLKQAVGRLEARQQKDASDREPLREQVIDFRCRLALLEERVQEIGERLQRD